MLPLWWLTKDGDVDCLALFERHYSAYRYADGRVRDRFTGPGERIVLRTERADAMFVWRNFIDASGQEGINCAVFRNESKHKSSELIRQADAIGPSRLDPALVERVGLAKAKRLGEVCSKGGGVDSKHRISTPIPFRDILISIAESAR